MSKKILVVDDESELVMVIKERLVANGFEVITAEDGVEAQRKIQEELPDLIILDVMMPKVDGFQLCRIVKFDEYLKHIPVIMLTARDQSSDKKIALDVGADAYLVKPFKSEELVNTVHRLLDARSSEE